MISASVLLALSEVVSEGTPVKNSIISALHASAADIAAVSPLVLAIFISVPGST